MIFQKRKEIEKNLEYDPKFIQEIQPIGGVSFKESFVRKGDGYETCIYIHDYPNNVDDFWLYKILNMNNVIATIDISDTNRPEVVKAINHSLDEQLSRFRNDKEQTERIQAERKHAELTKIFQQISDEGEVIKYINIRLYVSGRTQVELEDRVKEILDNLECYGFKGSILLNEVKYEWLSLMKGYKDSIKLLNNRKGKEIGARALAGGYPFHFTRLEDPHGTFFGTTFTGGNLLFDIFHKDPWRRYYNAVLIGTMGVGKSTTLKKLTTDNFCRNNFIRGIDVTGECNTLVKKLNGKMVALDGSGGIINPLQILRTDEDEMNCFMQHVSKLTTFYKLLSPSADDETCKEFKLLLRDFYIDIGILKENEGNQNLTNLNTTEYPIMSELRSFIKKTLYEDEEKRQTREELSETKVKRLESIELIIDDIVLNYGRLFNGHSTVEDIMTEQIVFFSIRSLSTMGQEVFNAQMFNVLNLIWDNMIKNGTYYKELFDRNKIDWEDIVRYLVVIDEAHKLINTRNNLAVQFLTDFAREARKYFGGLLFVSQSFRDFVPEGESENLNDIKTLFELTQYKFIMQQDSNSLSALRDIFGGSISESELSMIPKFKQGECLLSISGLGNITFNVEASPKEISMFDGGA